MSLKKFASLTLIAISSLCLPLRAEDQPASETPQTTPQENAAAPAIPPAGPKVEGAAPLPPTTSRERTEQAEKDFATFQGNPTRDDFARLEEHISVMRKALAPADDGQVWPQWFYQSLGWPAKRDADGWKAHFEKFDRWMAEFPDSPTPLTAKAGSHIHFGWEARGGGYANTVGEAQWAVFRDQINQAQELLEKASQMEGHDAEVYTNLVVVGMTQNADRETIDEHLAAARKIDPNYYPIYSTIAVNLLPRWGGNPGDIGEFAEQVAQDNPGDAGLEIYARIAAEVNRYDHNLLLEGEFDREKVRAGAKVLLARYDNATTLHNFAGLVGWRTQDWELAKGARKAVEENYARTVWGREQMVSEYKKFCDLKIAPPKRQRIVWTLRDQPRTTAISPSGNSLVIALQPFDGGPSLVVRSMKDLSLIDVIPGAGELPGQIAIDPTGTTLAVYTSQRMKVYAVGDWENPRTFEDERVRSSHSFSFSPDGKLLAAIHDGLRVGLWNVAKETLERTFKMADHAVQTFFSPDGALLAVAAQSGAQIFDVATGEELHRLPLKPAADGVQMTGVLAFHEDGRVLTTGTHKDRGGLSVMLWDRQRNTRKDLVRDLQGDINGVSPKGTFLIESIPLKEDNRHPDYYTIRIWLLQEGKMLAEYGSLGADRIYFSPDEKTMSFISPDKSVRLWDLSEFLPTAK